MTAGEQQGPEPSLWLLPTCPTCVSRRICWGLPGTGNPEGQAMGEEVSHEVQRVKEPGIHPRSASFKGVWLPASWDSHLLGWWFCLNPTRPSCRRSSLNVVPPLWALS